MQTSAEQHFGQSFRIRRNLQKLLLFFESRLQPSPDLGYANPALIWEEEDGIAQLFIEYKLIDKIIMSTVINSRERLNPCNLLMMKEWVFEPLQRNISGLSDKH